VPLFAFLPVIRRSFARQMQRSAGIIRPIAAFPTGEAALKITIFGNPPALAGLRRRRPLNGEQLLGNYRHVRRPLLHILNGFAPSILSARSPRTDPSTAPDNHLEIGDGLSRRDPDRRSLIESGVLGLPLPAVAALMAFDLLDD
jgi:hypothetical protein